MTDWFHECVTAARERGYDKDRAIALAEKAHRYATEDEQGHLHRGPGEGGGQFTGKPEDGQSPQDMAEAVPVQAAQPQAPVAPPQAPAVLPSPDQLAASLQDWGRIGTAIEPAVKALSKQWADSFRQRGKPLDANDLAQEARMAVWNARDKFNPATANFNTFANTIIQNRFKDLLKTKSGGLHQFPTDFDPGEVAEPRQAPSNEGDLAAMREAIAKLPERDRAIMEKVSQGVTLDDIGNQLGVSKGYVSKVIKANRETLRGMMPAEDYQVVAETLLRYEEDRQRGPWKRRSPKHPIASAANRLQSLEDHASEYNDEEIADVVAEIAEHFDADTFKAVARKFGMAKGQTKGEICGYLVEQICKARGADAYRQDEPPVRYYNPNHVPGGVPEGGQFTGSAEHGQSPDDMAKKLNGGTKPVSVDDMADFLVDSGTIGSEDADNFTPEQIAAMYTKAKGGAAKPAAQAASPMSGASEEIAKKLESMVGQEAGYAHGGATMTAAYPVAKALAGIKFSGNINPDTVASILHEHGIIGEDVGADRRLRVAINNPKAMRAVLEAAVSGSHDGAPVANSMNLRRVAQAIAPAR